MKKQSVRKLPKTLEGPCKIVGGKLIMCTVLDACTKSRFDDGEMKGLIYSPLTDLKTMKPSGGIVTIESKHIKEVFPNGLMISFCPYCGERVHKQRKRKKIKLSDAQRQTLSAFNTHPYAPAERRPSEGVPYMVEGADRTRTVRSLIKRGLLIWSGDLKRYVLSRDGAKALKDS